MVGLIILHTKLRFLSYRVNTNQLVFLGCRKQGSFPFQNPDLLYRKYISTNFIRFFLFGFLLLQGNMVRATDIGKNAGVASGSLFFLKESDKLISADQALALQKQGYFTKTENTTINFGNTKNRYWLYFELANDKDPADLILEIKNAHLYQLSLYMVRDTLSQLLHQTGSLQPFRQRPVINRNFAFPFILAPQESNGYLLMLDRRDEVLKFSIALYQKKAFEQSANFYYWFYGCFSGILLFIILFSIFLRITLRDQLYSWYFLYIVFLLLYVLSDSGLGYEFLWSEWPLLNKYARTFFGILAFMSQLRFMQLLLTQNRHNSRFYHAIRWIQYLFAIIMLITLAHVLLQPTVPDFWMMVYNLLFTAAYLIGCFLVMASLIEKYQQKNKEVRLYLLAIFPLFCHVILLMLTRWQVLENVDSSLTLASSATIELLILSFGLALKYNKLKQNKEELAVALYAEKKQTMEKVLDSQEEERKRIARDLHDDLGGTLATIKGMLSNIDAAQDHKKVLTQSQNLLDKACQDLRLIAHDLMPAEFDTLQLSTVLEETVQKINESSAISFGFISTGLPVEINKRMALTMYRIVNEALHNIIKHSQAKRVIVQLMYHNDHLQLLVEDDGIGFSLNKSVSDIAGIGLKNIFSRAAYLNAELHIDSGKSGTTIICNIPY